MNHADRHQPRHDRLPTRWPETTEVAEYLHAQPESEAWLPDGRIALGPDVLGVWVLAWHGRSGGGRIDVSVYPDEYTAWAAAAEAVVATLNILDGLPSDIGVWREAVDAFNARDPQTRLEVTFARFLTVEGDPVPAPPR